MGHMYDVVDEEKYRELVKSRQQREDFVVDDDDLGYADDGEDHLLNDSKQQDSGNRKSSKTPTRSLRSLLSRAASLAAPTYPPIARFFPHAFCICASLDCAA